MKELFKNAGLTSEDIATHLNSTLTVLAPTREAFAQFNNEDYQRFLEPVWQRHATEFLLNHISTPAMTREELVAQAALSGTITMLNGKTYELTTSSYGSTPRVRNGDTETGSVYFGDLIALNGYVFLCQGRFVLCIACDGALRNIYVNS
jgi:uncharacterized surface protein with fasciclin (FAS1) repeats